MSVLVLAEHDNKALKPATLNAVAAAAEIGKAGGGDVHVLVAGKDARPVAEAAAQAAGIAKVLLADDAAYEHGLAERWGSAARACTFPAGGGAGRRPSS